MSKKQETLHHAHHVSRWQPGWRRSIMGNKVEKDRAKRLARAAQWQAEADALNAELQARIAAEQVVQTAVARIEPADLSQPGPLRPSTLDDMVGQEKLKPLLRRLVANARASGRPLDHTLLVGASGTGKTTVSMVLARELGTRVFLLKAPVDMDTLDALRESAIDGDVIFVDEIHNQVHGDRRGITQACDPEQFYQLLEDGVLATPRGHVAFPRVTWIGATTDVGLLPEPLSNRFPLQPRLEPYTVAEMTILATRNAQGLRLTLEAGVAGTFAKASRLNPRQLNSYMRSAKALASVVVTRELAREVVEDLNGTTLDGLTPSMQACLRFLYKHCRRETRNGVTYRASANALATAAGHGRDTKAINLLVEPWLIQNGFLRVEPQGRTLTDAGVVRAATL